MTKLERKAAIAVAALTAGVVVSGIELMKKHTRYLAEKAAATFGREDEEEADGEYWKEVAEVPENQQENS